MYQFFAVYIKEIVSHSLSKKRFINLQGIIYRISIAIKIAFEIY